MVFESSQFALLQDRTVIHVQAVTDCVAELFQILIVCLCDCMFMKVDQICPKLFLRKTLDVFFTKITLFSRKIARGKSRDIL